MLKILTAIGLLCYDASGIDDSRDEHKVNFDACDWSVASNLMLMFLNDNCRNII